METIREYYRGKFPTDTLGLEINSNATFKGLFETLDNYGDVYEYIGVSDSLVRERLFERLAGIMDVEYKYIYDQYLKA